MTAWPTSGRAVLGLALVLVLGAALRIDRLGLEELTTDEAFSWRMTTYAPADVVARTATDVHPPLYYLALEAWTAAAGDSPAALRGLSLLLGLAAVVLAYLLHVEVDRHGGGGAKPAGRWGAVVAALLVAVHADQVGHSRHVRMYALGAALAGVTAWLVLRALRSDRRALAWWAAYSVSAAALCYTHYYGAFTVAAQLIAAGVFLAERWRASRTRPREVFALLAAALVVAALFAPWLSVLRRQTARVSEDYWIHDAASFDIAGALVRWMTGLEWAPPLPALTIALFTAAGLCALARGDRAQRFLALQAALPWAGALGLSWIAGRTLFLERYLFFSQLALLVYLARGWTGLPPWPRRAIAAGLGSFLALGLADEIGAPAGRTAVRPGWGAAPGPVGRRGRPGPRQCAARSQCRSLLPASRGRRPHRDEVPGQPVRRTSESGLVDHASRDRGGGERLGRSLAPRLACAPASAAEMATGPAPPRTGPSSSPASSKVPPPRVCL
jgi:hypothetical protein